MFGRTSKTQEELTLDEAVRVVVAAIETDEIDKASLEEIRRANSAYATRRLGEVFTGFGEALARAFPGLAAREDHIKRKGSVSGACHCFCGARHPGEAVCTGDEMTSRVFVEHPVPVCGPCAAVYDAKPPSVAQRV